MTRSNDRRRRHRGGRRGPLRPGFDGSRSRVANSQANDNVPVPAGLVFYCKSCETIIDFHPETFNFRLPQGLCPHAAAKKELATANSLTTAVPAGTEGATIQPAAAPATPPLRGRPRKDSKERQCEIVYGTERSIKHYFKIPDSRLDAIRREDEERAAKADKL